MLDVTFDDGTVKRMDMKPYLCEFEQFDALNDKKLFDSVHVDVGGCGLVWNEYADLSRYDIWDYGITI